MYQIISDSACDLTELYVKKHNIEENSVEGL